MRLALGEVGEIWAEAAQIISTSGNDESSL